MALDKDGFKPGTNYNERLRGRADPAAQIAAVLAQRAACAQGDHKIAVAEFGHRTRVGHRTLNPSTVYCACCLRVKGEPGWVPVVAADGQPLTGHEVEALDAMRAMGTAWPQSLMLVSLAGHLCVIRSADHDYVLSEAPIQDRFARVLAVIAGIPNDGGW